MNIKEIKEMIDLMNKNNLNELEIEKDGMRIRLKKSSGGISQQILDEKLIAQPVISKEKVLVREAGLPKTIEVKAPMVGTFYRSPSPEAPPFVDIGSRIEPGHVICIIEAMKLMNEIKSDIKGKIVDILVENGTPVEFGQVLFIIEPT